jgi:hypothetical protein
MADVINILKDVSVILGALTLVWKVVGFLKAATETAQRIPRFMDETSEALTNLQNFAHVAVENHLTHIQDHLGEMVAKKD